MTSEDSWEQRTDSWGPIVPIEKCPRTVWPYKPTHVTHTQGQTRSQQQRAGVYRIPCECGKVYIGETGRNLPSSSTRPQNLTTVATCHSSAAIVGGLMQSVDWFWSLLLLATIKCSYSRRVNAVSWLVLTSIATCHSSVAIVGGLMQSVDWFWPL